MSPNRHNNVLAIALLALTAFSGLWTTAAQAQQMYKCGSTYSQTPCAPDAQPKRVDTAAPAERVPGLSGYELCAKAAPGASGTPEPESARVQPLGERRSEVIQYAGQSIATHRYELTVDAKTQYGVFSGPQPYSCWLSEDQRRILRFSRAR